MKKRVGWIFGFLSLFAIFFAVNFSSGYGFFALNIESPQFVLNSLEVKSTKLEVYFDPGFNSDSGLQKYKITRSESCDQYDEYWNCIQPVNDLCPYIYFEPVNGEGDEVGHEVDRYVTKKAIGELDTESDRSDEWLLSVKSPCFEGECPTEYNPNLYGRPLPQSLKGKTFKCDVGVFDDGNVYPVQGLVKPVYADNSVFTVEAVLEGEAQKRVDPVIIIPGIMGSAHKNGEWLIDPIFHVYDNLIETLEKNGYVKNETLFSFGYDWKNSNTETAKILKDKIDKVKKICDCEKIDIVAHSMGGLVARVYAQSEEYKKDIDQMIFLGTPHRGAPKDYLTWEAGEFSPGLINSYLKRRFTNEGNNLGYDSLFDYIRNWPIKSVQELLPVFNYLKDVDANQIKDYPNEYPENKFLEDLNMGLVDFLESDIDVINIIGNTGINTISEIRVRDEEKLPLWEHGYPDGYDEDGDKGLELGLGDGTVPHQSSRLSESIDLEINSSHESIPTDAEEEIFAEINGGQLIDPVKTPLPLKILFAKIFSPADFVIIAPDGKRTGKDFVTGGEINEIKGSFYSGFSGDDEYVTIPDPIDGKYKIELQGVANGGVYSFETTYISQQKSETNEISGMILPDKINNLSIELNNNTQNIATEREVTVDILINDIIAAYKSGFIKDKKTKDNLISQAKFIIKFERKKNGKYENKVDKIIIKLLEKELDLLFRKSKITVEAKDLLRKDLSYIINHN